MQVRIETEDKQYQTINVSWGKDRIIYFDLEDPDEVLVVQVAIEHQSEGNKQAPQTRCVE